MSGSSEPKRILLVDDEKDITSVFKAGLERNNRFSVDVYNDPTQALSQFKQGHYHGIILDIRMPGMSGFELGREIWKKDPAAKICFLTAFDIYKQEAEKVFREFHEHCFITKPVSLMVLAAHIETHLLNA